MSDRSDLRAWALTVHEGCWWPSCDDSPRPRTPEDNFYDVLELAHIQARGMGHTGYQDRKDNVVMLCRWHHRHFDSLEQISQTSRLAFIAKVHSVGTSEWIPEYAEQRYITDGLATKWERIQWMQAIHAWRIREAAADV